MPVITLIVLTTIPLSLGDTPDNPQWVDQHQTAVQDPPPEKATPEPKKKCESTPPERQPQKDGFRKARDIYGSITQQKTNAGPEPIIDLLDVKDADLVDVLRFLCEKGGAQLVVDPSVGHIKVTCRLENISWLHAADIIIKNAGLDAHFEAGILKTGN